MGKVKSTRNRPSTQLNRRARTLSCTNSAARPRHTGTNKLETHANRRTSNNPSAGRIFGGPEWSTPDTDKTQRPCQRQQEREYRCCNEESNRFDPEEHDASIAMQIWDALHVDDAIRHPHNFAPLALHPLPQEPCYDPTAAPHPAAWCARQSLAYHTSIHPPPTTTSPS
jgi:hypothetical protein